MATQLPQAPGKASSPDLKNLSFSLSVKDDKKKIISEYKIKLTIPGDGKANKEIALYHDYPSAEGNVVFSISPGSINGKDITLPVIRAEMTGVGNKIIGQSRDLHLDEKRKKLVLDIPTADIDQYKTNLAVPWANFQRELGIVLPLKVLNLLKRKNISSLSGITTAGVVRPENGFSKQEIAELVRLNAHAGLQLVCTDLQLNERMIQSGISSWIAITKMTRDSFITKFKNKKPFTKISAAKIYDDTISKRMELDSLITEARIRKANGQDNGDINKKASSGYREAAARIIYDQIPDPSCECSCQSALSQLAYLADLLRFTVTNVQKANAPIDLSDLSIWLGQPFRFHPISCDAAEKVVYQLRICIETLYTLVENKANSAQINRMNATIYESLWEIYIDLLNRMGTSYDEIRSMRSATNAEKIIVAERLGLPADFLASLFFTPATLGNRQIETIFGFQGFKRNALSTGAKLNDDTNLIVYWYFENIEWNYNTAANGRVFISITLSGRSRKVEVFKDSGRTQLVAEGSVSSGTHEVFLSPVNESKLIGKMVLNSTRQAINTIEIAVIPEIIAAQSRQLRTKWLMEDYRSAVYDPTRFPIVDPDIIDENSICLPHSSQNRAYMLFHNRKMILQMLEQYFNYSNVAAATYRTIGEIFTSLTNVFNIPVYVPGATSLQPNNYIFWNTIPNWNQLSANLSSSDPNTRLLAAQTAATFNLDANSVRFINSLVDRINAGQVISDTGAERRELIRIVLNVVRLGLLNTWIQEEQQANISLSYPFFCKSNVKKAGKPLGATPEMTGRWNEQLNDNNRIPILDPDTITEGSLNFFSDIVLSTWTDRKAALDSLFTRLINARKNLTWLNNILTNSNLTSAGHIWIHKLGFTIGNLNTITGLVRNKKQIQVNTGQVGLLPDELKKLIQARIVLQDNPATITADDWETVIHILIQSEKRRHLYPLWLAAEQAQQITVSPDYLKEPGVVGRNSVTNNNRVSREFMSIRVNRRMQYIIRERIQSRIAELFSLVATNNSIIDTIEGYALSPLWDKLIEANLPSGPTLEIKKNLFTNRYLINAEESACKKTTRIQQAIETTQRFLWAIANNMYEFGNHTINLSTYTQVWNWLGTYDSWRAMVSVFLYPENFLLPQLLPDTQKSLYFKATCDILCDYDIQDEIDPGMPDSDEKLELYLYKWITEFFDTNHSDFQTAKNTRDKISRFDEVIRNIQNEEGFIKPFPTFRQKAEEYYGRNFANVADLGEYARLMNNIEITIRDIESTQRLIDDLQQQLEDIYEQREEERNAHNSDVYYSYSEEIANIESQIENQENCKAQLQEFLQEYQAEMSQGSREVTALFTRITNWLESYPSRHPYEVNYFIPYLYALLLERNAYYEDALPYYNRVFDIQDLRFTFNIINLENSYGDLTGSRINWLEWDLNPHIIAQTRRFAYGNALILSLGSCLIKLAESEFILDTSESLNRAREYFDKAKSILHSRRFSQVKDCEDIYRDIIIQVGEPVWVDTIVPTLAGLHVPRFGSNIEIHENYMDLIRDLKGIHANKQLTAVSKRQAFRSRLATAYTKKGIPVLEGRNEESNNRYGEMYSTLLQDTVVFKEIQRIEKQKGNAHGNKVAYRVAGKLNSKTIVINRPWGSYYIPAPQFGFCIPYNPSLKHLFYRIRTALYKLNNCQNFAGLSRPVPGQYKSNNSLPDSVVSFAPTLYRFKVLLQTAKDLANSAQALENNFISLVERYENAHLEELRSGQEVTLARANIRLQDLRLVESFDNFNLAGLQLDKAKYTEQHYDDLINQGLSENETNSLYALRGAALIQNAAAMAMGAIGAIGFGVAAAGITLPAGPAALLAAAGASTVGGSLGVVAGSIANMGSGLSTLSSLYAMEASFERRKEEWEFQRNLSGFDISLSEMQVTLAGDRINIVSQEKNIAELQAEQATEILTFLRNKFLNKEMYAWMISVIKDIYQYYLQQATSIAMIAQRQLSFERQEPELDIIARDYWQPNKELYENIVQGTTATAKKREGITGAERLLQDITKMEQHALLTDSRKLQLTKTISLALHDSLSFSSLRQTGVLPFITTLELFEQDYPGLYLCLIKKVKTTVIALIPPVDGIKAFLYSSNLSWIKRPSSNASFVNKQIMKGPDRVALTSPYNNTGLFELQDQSEMLFPFEGSGVAMSWVFEMPKAANQFDYNSIADVLITIEFTALHSEICKKQVIEKNGNIFRGERSVSLRQNFADQWYDLHNPDLVAPPLIPMEVNIPITRTEFPPNLTEIVITHVSVIVLKKDGFNEPISLDLLLEEQFSGFRTGGTSTEINGVCSTRGNNALAWLSFRGKSPFGTWILHFNDNSQNRGYFSDDNIEDILLVIGFSAVVPDWI